MSVYTVPCLWHIKQQTEEKERQGTGARGFSYQCVDARDACILCILCILYILCIQIPGVYAALFDAIGRGRACGGARCVSQKNLTRVCVCECELDATDVALSQIDKRSPCDVITERHNTR